MTKSPPLPNKVEALLLFLEELRVVRQLSENTIKAYNQDITKLYHLLSEHALILDQVQAHHVRNWVGKMHAQGLSAKSIARLLSAWRTFYDWVAKPNRRIQLPKITVNPVQDIKSPRKAKSLPKALSVEYAQLLMEFAKHETQNAKIPKDKRWLKLRDYAMLELFYSSGLRLSELLSIEILSVGMKGEDRLSWIDWESAEVHIFGKGGKRRIVPIGKIAMHALRLWKEEWEKRVVDGVGLLFINEKGLALSSRTVQARIEQLAKQAGIPTHVHPHMLRHTFASHVLQSSHDLRAVQEMLGHASIGSTQIYTSLDFQHLAQAYDLAHPRAKPAKS